MTLKRTHQFTAGDGTVRAYYAILEKETCPVCNPRETRENGVFGVISHNDTTTVLECLNCAHTESRDAGLIDHMYPHVRKAVAQAKLEETP